MPESFSTRLDQRITRFSSGMNRSRAVFVSMRLFCFALVAVLFFSAAVTQTTGQTARSRIEGIVTDPAGAKIIEARVTLRDKTGVAYQSATNNEGRYSINNVAGGQYAITVEAVGFAQKEKRIIDVPEGGAADMISADVQLDISAISDRMVVTATRTESAETELGGSVSIITSGQFDRSHPAIVSESLRVVPGLSVAQTGGRGGLTSIFIRGGKSDYNKVLFDGVPVNAAGGLFDYSSLTPENLDRIEVVRGPQSALFGSDAMTGVVQLFTKRGTTSMPEFDLSAEGGSYDFHRETARLSGLAGRFDYSASFGFQSTNGRFRNNDFISRSASTNLGYRLADDIDLRLTSRFHNNTRGVPGPTAIVFADPDHRLKHHDISFAAVFDWKTSSRIHQVVRHVYSEFETHSFDPVAQDLTRPDTPVAAPGSFGPDFAFSFIDHQKRAGIQYQAIAAVTDSTVITAGVDFEHESAVFTDDFSRVSPSRNNLGVYAQWQSSVHERLFMTAGVRIERNRGKIPEDLRAVLEMFGSAAPSGEAGFGITANPKLALSFLARAHKEGAQLGATRLKASFGTGIKESRLDEAFSPSPFFIGNPLLDPERCISYDAGISQDFFNRRLNLDLTYFDNRFRDIIIFTLDTVTFGPIRLEDGRLTNMINLERASARGIELIGAARPIRQLRVAASYTYARSRLERTGQSTSAEIGLPLIRRPQHVGTMELNWVAERYDISLEGSFVGKRRECDPVTCARFDLSGNPFFTDGYAKLNAAGSYRFNNAVTGFARVENLLNQDYEEILGYPANRINISAGLRLKLGGGK